MCIRDSEIAALSDTSMLEDGYLQLELNSSDVDDDTLSYQIWSDENFAELFIDRNDIYNYSDDTLFITPYPNWFGSTEIYISVSDDALSDTMSFTLNVESVDDPPTADMPFADVITYEDSPDTTLGNLDSLFTDIDGELEFSVTVGDTNLIDVMINEWFGEFYDMIQKALGAPYSITISEYWASLFSFITLAGIYVAVYVVVSFFTQHFLFRWRTAMVEWYHSVYEKARKIEGASQRVQEDTIKFSRIMEGLGTALIESIMILIQFIPILLGLSFGIPIFFFGDWQYGLITGALLWTIGGTVFLIGLGWILRLVGVEYDIQKKEAAYRKILVIAEDDGSVRPKKIEEFFDDVRKIHFLSYLRYLCLLYTSDAADE